MSDNVDAKIVIEFTARSVTSRESLIKDFDGDLRALVTWLIEEEGLFGIVEDEYEIVEIVEVTE